MSEYAFDRAYKSDARISAPPDRVWDELVPLTRHFPESPAVSLLTRTDPVRALMRVNWGPIAWRLETTISIVELRRAERLEWAAEVDGIEAWASGVVALDARGSAETLLDYEVRAWMRQQRRVSRGVATILSGLISDHCDQLVARVTEQAEKHTMAEQRLLHRGRRIES